MTQSLDPTKLEAHPLALIVPRPSRENYRALCQSIRASGQREPISLYEGKVLEGWSRACACKDLRIKVIAEDAPFHGDAAAARTFVLDKNVARRHLNNAQKRELVAKLLRAAPEVSNRQIASSAKVDDKTVGVVRKDMERRAEIPHVSRRADTAGRLQAAERKVLPPEEPEDDEDEEQAEPDAEEEERRPESKPEYWEEEIEWRLEEAKEALSADDFNLLRKSVASQLSGYSGDAIGCWLENGDKDAVTKWLAFSLASRLDREDVFSGIRAIAEEEEREAIEYERRRLEDFSRTGGSRMTEADYDRERARIRETYGENSQTAGTRREQELARLMEEERAAGLEIPAFLKRDGTAADN